MANLLSFCFTTAQASSQKIMIFSQYSSLSVCLRNEGFLGLYIKCVLELPALGVSCKLREGVKRKKDHEKWTVLIEQSRQNV